MESDKKCLLQTNASRPGRRLGTGALHTRSKTYISKCKKCDNLFAASKLYTLPGRTPNFFTRSYTLRLSANGERRIVDNLTSTHTSERLIKSEIWMMRRSGKGGGGGEEDGGERSVNGGGGDGCRSCFSSFPGRRILMWLSRAKRMCKKGALNVCERRDARFRKRVYSFTRALGKRNNNNNNTVNASA